MTIDDIPTFNKASAITKLTTMWGWLGPDAAEDILDQIAAEIQEAIEAAA